MKIKKINDLKEVNVERNELNVFFYKNIKMYIKHTDDESVCFEGEEVVEIHFDALVGGVYANETINNSNGGVKTLLNVRAIFKALHKPYYVYNIMANDEKKGRTYKKFFQSQGIPCNVKIVNPKTGLTYKIL